MKSYKTTVKKTSAADKANKAAEEAKIAAEKARKAAEERAAFEAALNLARKSLAVLFEPMFQTQLCDYVTAGTGVGPEMASKIVSVMIKSRELDTLCSSGYSYYHSNQYYLDCSTRLGILREIQEQYTVESKDLLLKQAENFIHRRWDDYWPIKKQLGNNLAKALIYNTHIELVDNPGQASIPCDFPVKELAMELMENPEKRKGFENVTEDMPWEILWDFCCHTVSDATSGDWDVNYDECRNLVERNKAITKVQKDKLMEKLSFPLCTLRGEMDNPGFDMNTPSVFNGFIFSGTKAYLAKDWTGAVKCWRQAIKLNNSKSQLPEISLFDVLYIIALNKSGGKMNLKTLDSLDKKHTVTGDLNTYVFRLVIDSFYGRKVNEELVNEILRGITSMDTLDKYTAYTVMKSMDMIDGKYPSTKEIGEELESDKDYGLLVTPGLIPFEQKADWEWAMENIVTKLGYGTSEKQSTAKQTEPTSKIVYLIDKSLSNVQPVLKKSKDGIIWTSGRNIALKTFAQGIPEMSPLDRQIATNVKYYDGGWYGGKYYKLNGDDVIPLLVGSRDVYMMDKPDIRIEIANDDPYISTIKDKSGKISFQSNINIGNLDKGRVIKRETDTLVKVIVVSTRQKEIMTTLNNISFPAESLKEVKKLIGYLSKDIVVHTDLVKDSSELKEIKCDSRITVVLMPEGNGLRIDFYVKPFGTVPPYFTPGRGCPSVITHIDGTAVQTKRNLKNELDNLAQLHRAIDKFIEEDRDDSNVCQSPADCLAVLDVLRSMGDSIHTEWPEGAKFKIVGNCDLKDVNILLKSKTNWFEVGGTMQVSDSQVLEMSKVLELLRSSEGRFIRIGENEFISLSAKLKQQLDNLSSIASETKGDKLRVPQMALPVIGEMGKAGINVNEDDAAKRMLKCIEDAENTSFSIPKKLKAELRPYQEEGYKWLCRLASWGAGACLADDMGLGKTVQTIALMVHRVENGPALVVAPASVLSNWEKEILRFAPSLSVTVINSLPSDERKEAVTGAGAYSVVLTTYGVLVSETETLSSRQWGTVVLDEAHVIKNKETKSAAACNSLKADFRMILTGTPLQNHLGEIWSLFQFINPGYLGTFNEFSAKFLEPIQERNDKQAQSRLKKLLLPFLLRRTKSDVLDELPEKTEQTILVDLSDTEKALYESLRRNAELMVEEHQANLVQTLAEILKLRQAACCPALVREGLPKVSSKVDELLSLVDKIVSGGHKALIFSQFTSFLSIIRESLDKSGITYEYLDGSTPVTKRPEIVKSFQTGSAPLFLISLKAGGLGLNLTAADYIILTDPWWNPSVEDQASDRAYRIGQTRPVTIYRLIAHDTIEEKILDMHRDKRSLADSLLEGSDISTKLTREELLNILKG